MAQQADGTVYVDTLLDTTGFKAGGKEVEAAAKRMAKTVSNIGNNAKTSTKKLLDSFMEVNKPVNELRETVDSLRQKMDGLREQKVTTDKFKAIEDQIKKIQRKWMISLPKINSLLRLEEARQNPHI